MSVAAENRCRMLLTEDLNEGFVWRGVTVVNPFSISGGKRVEDFLCT